MNQEDRITFNVQKHVRISKTALTHSKAQKALYNALLNFMDTSLKFYLNGTKKTLLPKTEALFLKSKPLTA